MTAPRFTLALVVALTAPAAGAQQMARPGTGDEKTPNIKVVSHVPLGRALQTGSVEIDQDVTRPFAFVSRVYYPPAGFDIISLKDPQKADVVWSWTIGGAAHVGMGAVRGRLFKSHGRSYYVQSVQFARGTPDDDLGAVIFNVTGLPDTAQVKEVARIRAADAPGGFHSIFVYKHSDGRPLLFASASAKPYALVYDLDKAIAHDAAQGFVGQIRNPDRLSDSVKSIEGAVHDLWAGYDPGARRDRLYMAGQGGYYVFDVSAPQQPRLITSVTGVMGIFRGHSVAASPDGRYLVTGTDYQYSPLRTFDLQRGLEGKAQTISQPLGAWAADWHNMPHNAEVRWPYVFVASYEDGLQVINMLDPSDPVTVAYYRTYDGPHQAGCCSKEWLADPTQDPKGRGVINGAFGVAVRNADGLIVVSDMTTGLWTFYMDGFNGWSGRRWGMPDVSTAQNWEKGPTPAVTTLVP